MSQTPGQLAAKDMDWMQVILNGGPPCFFIDEGRFCLRAKRWEGHNNEVIHPFVSLAELLTAHDAEVRAELLAPGPCGEHPRIFVKKDVHPSDEYHSLGIEKITETCNLCLELDKVRVETLARQAEMLASMASKTQFLFNYWLHQGYDGLTALQIASDEAIRKVGTEFLSPDPHYRERIELEARQDEAEWWAIETMHMRCDDSCRKHARLSELKSQLAALDAPKEEVKNERA